MTPSNESLMPKGNLAGDGMKMIGWALIALGLIALFAAMFGMDTSVDSARDYSDALAGYPVRKIAGGVYNLGLMQTQNQTFMAGLAGIISGIVLYVGGAIVGALMSRSGAPKE